MRTVIVLVCVVFAMIAISCGSSKKQSAVPARNHQWKLDELKSVVLYGKSEGDVKSLLGEPDRAWKRTSSNGVMEYWVFEYQKLIKNEHSGAIENVNIEFTVENSGKLKTSSCYATTAREK